mgnify:CR=1 FL=1
MHNDEHKEEKLPLFTRLNDAIDTGFQRTGKFIADAAQDRPGIGDDIVRGGIRGLSFVGNLPVIKQIGQLEDKLVDTVGNLADKQSVVDPRSFRYTTRVATMFIPYAGAAKVVSKGKVASKLSKLKSRMFNKLDDTRYFTRDEILEMGIGQPQLSRFADEIEVKSAKNLINELELRSVDLGYKVSDVTTNTRRNQFGMPNEISTAYLNHAEAYKNALKSTGGTLEKFPTLIWKGVRYRPKSKPLNNKTYVYFERYIDRRTRKKLGQDRRSLRIWKQTSKDVPKGTFYREKLKQLRELNAEEKRLGVPEERRTKLREVDMDHKNALRTVEIYTEGLSEANTKFVFDLLERYGLFTGDDSRNLILRNKEIHAKVYGKLKRELKKLNHKTIHDFKNAKNPELEYLKYLAGDIKNPKYSDDTPLREYIDTILAVEEQANLEQFKLMHAKLSKYKASRTLPPPKKVADPVRDRLVEILGGEEGLKVFVERLKREYPKELQTDMLRGEFEHLGSFGPIDELRLRRILDE